MSELTKEERLAIWGPRKRSKNKSGGHKDPQKKKEFNALYQFRKSLPIWKSKKQIIELIANNPTTILVGETGCGKSTQVPQFLVDSFELKGCRVAVTQPRRVSATSLAARVAAERNCEVGSYVGYSVRFDNKSSPKSYIKYVTDGMLLREILVDNDLSAYNVVILDEIHERTVQTDLLIGLLRNLQARRSDLKLILMSATLNCKLFVDFFNGPPIIHVEGRTFKVAIKYTDEPQTDYIEATTTAVLQLNEECDKGDFLVFLTGQEEIEEVMETLKTEETYPPLKVLPLYAALPMYQQQEVFNPVDEGTRKVILSTNIAETSVTIPGIKYVIDSGLVKVKTYNPVSGIEILGVTPCAKAQVVQRAGRAGRESEGIAFRLFTEDSFFDLKDQPVAEIRRADLSSVVLQLFALGVKNPMTFGFLERPPTEMIQASIQQLWSLGALTPQGELSDDGKVMANFPMNPKMTKILLLACQSGCGGSALTLLAMMSCENLYVQPANKRKEARNAHSIFIHETGDHVTLIRLYEAFAATPKEKQKDFCFEKFVSLRALQFAVSVRSQLLEIAEQQKLNVQDADEENRFLLIRQAISIACPENVATQISGGKYKCVLDGTEISIHPSSFAFNKGMKTIVFSERVQTKKLYARWVSASDEKWTDLVAPTLTE